MIMGGTSWSADHVKERAALRAASGTPTFAHHYAVSSGTATGIHPSLDPNGVTIRESRDSTAHPEAVPISVLCDVTGSMREVPRIVQRNLTKLMGLLIRKGYVEHPAIMVGAIGDATSDQYPLQVGQFESGIEIEDNLTNLILEGGGGGQTTESYELALYFMARHTAHDHFEKRGEKGYLFIIGDEMPYQQVKRHEALKILGSGPETDIPTIDVMREVQERYQVFFILPKMTANFNDKRVRDTWKSLVGQNTVILDDAMGICECIASQVGTFEGTLDSSKVESDLIDVGASSRVASAVSKALVPVGAGGGRRARGAIQQIPESGGVSGVSSF
jgi:hypothetical protein